MSHLSLPIATELLADYLPHRPPMRWVDEVIAVEDTGGTCRVLFNPEAHYCDAQGRLRNTAFVEWMAQAYGYIRASQVALGKVNISHIPKVTFLAQIRAAKLPQKPMSDRSFFVHVHCVRVLGPLSLVSGKVMDSANNIVATAELKLYAE